mmetsp:Transcript_20028/g.57977  ORF Transcript_20028/g.57977 Transcript_20028/m.57977 type:complete len:125 (-) Transcript_20028:165-539(-)
MPAVPIFVREVLACERLHRSSNSGRAQTLPSPVAEKTGIWKDEPGNLIGRGGGHSCFYDIRPRSGSGDMSTSSRASILQTWAVVTLVVRRPVGMHTEREDGSMWSHRTAECGDDAERDHQGEQH